MAYKDSDELQSNENYALGEYSFRIERFSVPGSTNDKIEAICTQGGKNARKSIQVPSSTKLDGWYVEANETEATVYALIQVPKGGEESGEKYDSDFGQGPWPQPVNCVYGSVSEEDTYYPRGGQHVLEGNCYISFLHNESGAQLWNLLCSSSPFSYRSGRDVGTQYERWTTYSVTNNWTYNGKTVYFNDGAYDTFTKGIDGDNISPASNIPPAVNNKEAAWIIVYGTPVSPTEYETKEMLIGRFAIEIEDAGGVGPGSDWIDPGDYDPDWEPDDPTYTLYVTVTGALSGRHNDPIVDPSYSYIPADKDAVKDYGCGGDGGHGGGGGAGASTVVVHKFATNQANSKEVTAIARRHGYGSGGGKGGKGGDGCILVYY